MLACVASGWPVMCSTACPPTMTGSPTCSPSARTGAGGGRWSAGTAAGSPRLVLDVATGPAGSRAGGRRPHRRERGRGEPERADAARRAGPDPPAGPARPGPGGRGPGRRAAVPDATFDAVTFSYLLRYVDDPAATVAEMARCLRPGGTLASLEFYVRRTPGWRAAWWLYTRLALPVLGGLTGGQPGTGWAASSGRASPRTTSGTPSTSTSPPGGRRASPTSGSS